ncbi:type I pullulanase [Pontibacter sp. CAU 1760]
MATPSDQATPTAATYNDYPAYPEENLWPTYTPGGTTFKLWSPVAEAVALNLYAKGHGGEVLQRHALEEVREGLWQLTLQGDWQGVYYTYQVKVSESWLDETPGIYAQAVGVNGKRAMVLDLATTNPPGWAFDKGPQVGTPNEVILYELHVRDMTVSPNAGSTMPGKFLGLMEPDTHNREQLSTGIDHLIELGITHVHLLPSFDFMSVDEAALDKPQYNWGYDPQNYNVPEGSYATDAYRAEVRIQEFKKTVLGFHQLGLGVVLDVVYNHTGLTEDSNFNLEVPGYYYRHTASGGWSNASGCGNETASERTMMRKFMIESCCYWATEYHIDGFRFDLMAIHDLETMNLLSEALKKINPNIILYGEGWTAGASPLPEEKQALKSHTHRMTHVSAFSDTLRDGLKGSVFDVAAKGFVNGAPHMEELVKFGVVGCTAHPEVQTKKTPWARDPWQSVSYASCHDNHTLYDKLKASAPQATETEIYQMHLLANAVVLTAQGIPFLHAGVEMLRSKQGHHNSYNLPDAINQLDWDQKTTYYGAFTYLRQLIALRKAHPAFYMPTAAMVREHLRFLQAPPGCVGYTISGHANNDSWANILMLYNANPYPVQLPISGEWQVAASEETIDLSGMRRIHEVAGAAPRSMLLLFQV